jgi:exodeoxyribonuclease-3
MSKLTIASWNINSVRIRLPLIQQFLAEHQPDILCLQETKTEDGTFPLEGLRAFGFEHILFAGQKSYNGVAILSKLPLSNPQITPMCGFDDKRHIGAQLPDGTWLHNFYIPAGGDEPDPAINPKFDHKLKFVDAMTAWSKEQKNTSTIICGDFNIAPLEHDVWSSKQLRNVVSHTAIEREKLNALKDTIGWIDTHREHVPANEKLYSWWSYRNRDWNASDRGRRLDHLWITPNQKDRLIGTHIHRPARGWESPSDHVPIITELKLSA